MVIKVLDRATMGYDLDFGILSELGRVELYDATEPQKVEERVCDADVIILNKVKITEAVMKNAKNLKLVCVFATGFDNVDISAAKSLGIGVANVPAYSTDSVALFTVATTLSLFAHLAEYKSFVSSGEYTASNAPNRITPVYRELSGKTWGIVGYGNIGKRVADIARAFGARVMVNKRTPTADAECVDIETLCRVSDIITLHCPLNDTTRGLIGKRALSLMKPTAILVNEARGAVVDEAAVADAIEEGRIAAFGSDVYSEEPFSPEHPFNRIKGRDNVLLTPHAAWAALEARERCLNIIKTNIKSYKLGKFENRVDI